MEEINLGLMANEPDLGDWQSNDGGSFSDYDTYEEIRRLEELKDKEIRRREEEIRRQEEEIRRVKRLRRRAHANRERKALLASCKQGMNLGRVWNKYLIIDIFLFAGEENFQSEAEVVLWGSSRRHRAFLGKNYDWYVPKLSVWRSLW